ncbi:MAG: ABC transporter ATP-binding protein [Alkalibacterium sp.]
MRNNTLEVEDLSFQIGGKKLIDSVSFNVAAGEIVLICGMSGSGKSTLTNIINGYFPEYGGKQTVKSIRINREEVKHQSVVERSASVRTIFQNARLSFSMKTLREEMIFVLENARVAVSEMDAIVSEKARHFGLEYLLDRSLDDLSGGELQRAAFVCADLVDVPLYIMDEPFANVDEETLQDYIGYMKASVKKGKSILIIDHHVDRWSWVDRWLMLDSNQKLHDLSLKESDSVHRDFLKKEGILTDALSVEKRKSENADILLELDKVSIYHEKTVRKSLFRKETHTNTLLENADLKLSKGSLTALVGPSGIGKTSLFRAILNVSPYKGDIRLNGESVKALEPKALYSKIGLVFQDPSLQFVKTKVLDEMALSLTAWNTLEEEKAASEAREILSRHHFDDQIDKSPWVMSQGQQRRLAVLCMTVGGQQLLLVDEPTYGQDARNSRKIMDKLDDLCQKGMTCLFTSHDRELVDAYADQVYEIRERKVWQLK